MNLNLNRIKCIGVILMLALLTACGGGGGNPGTSSGGSSVSTPLFTSAPGAITLSSGTTSPVYSISGGVAPYTANSDKPSLLSVSLNESGLTITAVTGNSGSGTVLVTDSKGTKITVTVTVPAPTALFSTAPANLTLAIGASSSTYSVTGGTGPYTAVSTNPALVGATISAGTNLLTISALSGTAGGTANVIVADSKGNQLTVVVTVSAPTALFSTAPANLTLAIGASSSAYSITGGAGSYTAVSTNQALVGASISAGTNLLTISALTGTAGGKADVIVSDAKGNQLTVVVTVSAPTALFSTAPANLTLAIGASSSAYSITGGAGSYTAVSTNQALVGASISAGTNLLTISALTGTAGGKADVIVSDAKGNQLTVAVTVSAPIQVALFVDAPANLTVGIGVSSNSYTISGGTGPYTAVSSNTAVLTLTALSSTGKFAIQGVSAGNASVTVKDAMGIAITISVTVPAPAALFSTAPGTLQILSGTTNFYTLFGGTAPYVVNTNGVIAKAVLSGTSLAISGLVVGHQTVAVSDAKGSMISIDVTVNQGLYTDAPANLTVASGTGATYSIYGGVPYSGTALYRVNSSNPAIASATVTGSLLSITGLSSGSTTLVISDSLGGTSLVAVTVPAAGALMSTAPSSLKLATGSSGVYAITGGGGNYTATSSNPVLVSASVSNGSTLTIGAAADTLGGTANVIVTDSAGTAPLTITVTAAPVQFFTTAPSSLTIAAGGSKIFAVVGGSLPYTVVNTHPSIALGLISGTTLSISGAVAGSGTVLVNDAKGVTISIAVTVSAPGPLTVSAPSGGVTLASGSSATYDVFGGSPAYLTSSSDINVAMATIVNGNQVKVDALGSGKANIAVIDSVGTQVMIAVTVPGTGVLFIDAPLNLTVSAAAPGNTYIVTISGGTKPYTAVSSNMGVATVNSIGPDGKFTIQGVSTGNATVTVKDATGLSPISISVTVPAPNLLFTDTPSNLTLAVGSTNFTKIYGGSGTYVVNNSNPAAVTTTLTGSSLSIVAKAVGVATVAISDTSGSNPPVLISVTVPQPSSVFTDAPANLTLAKGTGAVYTIFGGVQLGGVNNKYNVNNGNPTVASATMAGSTLTISALAVGSSTLVISDSVGASISIVVTVSAPGALMSTAPSPLALVTGTTSNSFAISGGVGSYTVQSANPALISALVTTSGSASSVSITALPNTAGGTANVIVSDANGTQLTIVVNVTVPVQVALFIDAPLNLTISSVGPSNTYPVTISGGTKPYTAVSGNLAVAAVSAIGTDGKFTVTGVGAGFAAITIKDATGSPAMTISVTVPAPSVLITDTPQDLTLAIGSTNFTKIYGGTGPYTVNNSNPTVVTTPIGEIGVGVSNFSIIARSVGTATIVVSDAAGNRVPITVTVPVPSAVFTNAPANLTLAKGTGAIYSIFGGVQLSGANKYTVNSGNPTVALGSISGTTLTVSTSAIGTSTLVISDSVGASISIVVTVSAPGALMSTAPSNLTLAMGTQGSTYAVSGGVPFVGQSYKYTAFSSNPAILSASIIDSSLTIAALPNTAGGLANVIVTDVNGTQLTIAVTVPAPSRLSTTAPSILSIQKSAQTYSYKIFGGFPPYTAHSSDTSIVSSIVPAGTSDLQIAALNSAGNGGVASVVVTDAQGNSAAPIQVRVGSSTALFSNAPGDPVTLVAGTSYQYLVYGGSFFDPGVPGSYSAASTNPGVVSASFAGPVLTVTALANGSSTVRITDAVGTPLDIRFIVGSGSSTNTNYPALTPVLQTGGGVATSSIDATGYTLLKVTMKDPSGVGIANQVISVTGDLTKLSFPEGNAALTDASGIATIKVARASLLATGAGVMTVTYDYKPGMISSYSGNVTPPSVAQVITTYVGYQVTTANISLTNLDVGTPATMKAYGTQQVSVIANVNGVPATSTPVTVSFSATCGQVLPATASTDSAGKVLVTYSATDATGTLPSTLGCSGKTVQITASSSGATAVSQNIAVAAAPATSISFVSAAPNRIYLANACGVNPSCLTQSILTFQLLNQSGEGIAGQSVRLTLKSLNGGTPKASFDTVGSVAPVTLTTDSTGKVSQPVYSGAVPTNVIVNASLVATPTIQTDSSILAIASGRPVQARLSLALEKLSIEGFNVDGTTATVTLNLADRQGNPVPDGTVVNFVTEGGVMIPPTCTTGAVPGDSTCAVTIRSGNPRPANGLVTILAYVAGEEDFVDSGNGVPGTAGNNIYDCGEPFTDLGIAYRDDAMTSSVLNAYAAGEFTVPRAALTSACVAGVERTAGEGVPGTHDAVWGAADVRKQAVVVYASSSAVISNAAAITKDSLTFTVADVNGNSMPTGTNIVVTAGDNTPTNSKSCRIFSGSSTVVPNTLTPLTLFASFLECEANDRITVKVTSPLGTVTESTYTIP